MQLTEVQTEAYDEENQPPGILYPVLGQAKSNQLPIAIFKLFKRSISQQIQVQIFYDHLFVKNSKQLYCMNFDYDTYLGYDLQTKRVWLEQKEAKSRQVFSTGSSEQLQNFIFQLKRRCPQQGFYQQFSLLEETGKGNNSKTCLCKRKCDGQIFAVKIQFNSSRVQSQIQILKELEHPNIIFMREFFIQQDGKVYTIMDYENGGNLLDIIKSQKQLSYIEKLKVVIDMINALQFLRIKSIIHRDIKPQNIVFSKMDGNYKICDFGLAIKSGTKINKISGTPGYMAPELFQIDNGSHIEAAVEQDIYSMGLTFYELFTQKQYYEGVNQQQILTKNVKVISFRKRNYRSQQKNGVQKKLLEKMIRKDARDRRNSFQIMQSSVYGKISHNYGRQAKSSSLKTKSKSSSSDQQNFFLAVKKLLRIQTT